uniref:Uncharacterized protein n=1 Tax=Terrapene triunguis TaxID=2587831 RepID=A0A674IDR1_9SAUR
MSGAAGSGGGSVGSVVRRFLAEYSSGTASRLKVLDAYLLYVLLSGALHNPAFSPGHLPLQLLPQRLHLGRGQLHPGR